MLESRGCGKSYFSRWPSCWELHKARKELEPYACSVQLFAFCPGFAPGRSLLYEIAKLMQSPVKLCESGCCVEITHKDGRKEKRLLEIDESVASPTDPCELYVCTVSYIIHKQELLFENSSFHLFTQTSGLLVQNIDKCIVRPCLNGSTPVLYPGNCCPKCGKSANTVIVHDDIVILTSVGRRTEGACNFTEWSDFGPCSVECGEGGMRARVRRLISVNDNSDFVNCSANLTDLQPCFPGPCRSK